MISGAQAAFKSMNENVLTGVNENQTLGRQTFCNGCSVAGLQIQMQNGTMYPL